MQKFILASAGALLYLAHAIAFAQTNSAQFTAGFITVPAAEQTPALGIWYPSVAAETVGELGPYRPRWAWDGAAASGKFPIIILSHGRGGWFRNHHGTAAHLARHGYIVVAPNHHFTDRALQPPQIIPPITRRANEISSARAAALAQPRIGKIAAANRVGALGYSLGTLTVLYAAGARPLMQKFSAHCRMHRNADPEFCGGDWRAKLLSSLQPALQYLRAKGILRPRKETPWPADKEFQSPSAPINFNAIALVAPVGAPFTADQLQNVTAAVALFRLGDDAQLRYPFHAEYLRQTFAQNKMPATHQTFHGVHHGAFIAKLPQHILDEENDPELRDPSGFDRDIFLRDINARLLRFFQTNL